MKIISNAVQDDIEKGTPINLNLGSGGTKKEGFYGVDHLPIEHVDIVADLNQPLTELPDNSVNKIYSRHALEHIDEFLPLMRELHRITQKDGELEIIVPHFSNVYGYSDPTHVRFFGLYTMYYFVATEDQPKKRPVPAFYTDTRFKVEKIKIEFYSSGILDKIVRPIITRWINSSFFWQDFYERRLSSLFHAWQIRFIMKPIK